MQPPQAIDTTILREAERRIERKFANVPRACCPACMQNPGYQIDEVIRTMQAIADHAEGIPADLSSAYEGIYHRSAVLPKRGRS